LGLSCAKKPFHGVPIDSLKLQVVPHTSAITVGQPTELDHVLVNAGDKTIEACIGEGWAFHVFGSEMDNRGEIHAVDHPSCQRRFSLAVGEEIRWTKEVEVPVVSAGAGSLNGSIQLVDPHNCHRRYGCYAKNVSSEIAL